MNKPSSTAKVQLQTDSEQVEAVETQDAQEIRRALLASRQQNLTRLQQYIDAGVFPKNKVQPGLLNVFQDDEGHLCAVANLINLDGYTELISTTAVSDNYIVLAQQDSGPVVDWILASGFTQEEIGKIQVPYMGESNPPLLQELDEDLVRRQLAEFRRLEVQRLQSALTAVHAALVANTESSIDVALQRVISPKHLALR